MNSSQLSTWLQDAHSVSALKSTCETWLRKTWSSDGVLRSVSAVEECIGEHLRLSQYKDCFSDDCSAEKLSEVLAESEPPSAVSAQLLRQWYSQFHPESGAIQYNTVAEFESGMGDLLRKVYHGVSGRSLQSVLSLSLIHI